MDAWDVRALHEDPDVAATRQAIRTDLERGATSIWLRVDPDAIARPMSPVPSPTSCSTWPVDVSSRTDQVAAARRCWASSKHPRPTRLSCRSTSASTRSVRPPSPARLPDLSGLSKWVERLAGYSKSRAFVVDGTIYHNAGAGDVHEVAWLLASAVSTCGRWSAGRQRG